MTAPSMVAQVEPTTARFGRLEQRGLLVGLGFGQLVVLAVALLIAVTGVYSAGASGLVVSGALWLPLVAVATVKVGGRTLIAWVPVAGSWQSRKVLGSTREVARLTAPVGLHVPGIAGDLRVSDTPTLGAALIHDRRTDTVTAIARVAGSGFTLDATATQSHKVDSWGEADPDRSHLPRCQGGLIDQVVPGVWDTARREGACRQTGLAVETGESGAALYRLSLAARQPFGNHRKSVDR